MEQLALFGEDVGRPPAPPPDWERDRIFYALLLGPQVWRASVTVRDGGTRQQRRDRPDAGKRHVPHLCARPRLRRRA